MQTLTLGELKERLDELIQLRPECKDQPFDIITYNDKIDDFDHYNLPSRTHVGFIGNNVDIVHFEIKKTS